MAQVGVGDDPVHLPIEPITLTENLLRNDRAPKGERDRAGCINGNVTGPDPIGTNHGMPIDRRGPCKNAVKVVRVLRGDGNSLSPSSRTTVVIRVMWCRAVIALSDLFSNSHRHVYRAIGEVDKVFGVGWQEEWDRGEVSIVSAVCSDCSEVEVSTAVESWVRDT